MRYVASKVSCTLNTYLHLPPFPTHPAHLAVRVNDPMFRVVTDQHRWLRSAFSRAAGHFAAFDFMFEHMSSTGYVQAERLQYNVIFPVQDEPRYKCRLELTINCSKPELKAAPGGAGVTRKPTLLAPGAHCVIAAEQVRSSCHGSTRKCAARFSLGQRRTCLHPPTRCSICFRPGKTRLICC